MKQALTKQFETTAKRQAPNLPKDLEAADRILLKQAEGRLEKTIRERAEEISRELEILRPSQGDNAAAASTRLPHLRMIGIDLGQGLNEKAVRKLEGFKAVDEICARNDVNLSVQIDPKFTRARVFIDLKEPYAPAAAPRSAARAAALSL